MSLDSSSSTRLLKDSYLDATRKKGLIDFTKEIRGQKNDFSGKYQIKLSDLHNLFSETVWEDEKKTGGHIKLKHKVTNVVIEYKNHGKNTVDPGAALDIFDQVQTHLNILGNDIFAYKTRNWKQEPVYQKAISNL
ncbi:MAG: hypothetical protein K1060chlam1_00409 [Candidatus Anoxychlamydiales bacterium]|nr:hypothetical protein [Candidatus Anoxychlamydiales bacterium]